MDKTLQNQVAFVSGAGSGIGRALALELARHGARVACCGRRRERLEETQRLIENEGGAALAVAADILERGQVQSAVAATREQLGEIDILFNNAGSFQSIAGVHEADPDVWWHDVEVNLKGAFLLIREVLPGMLTRDRGVIINMNGGRPVGGSGYACGKAGLMELTRVLANELELQNSNVLVYGAGPGLVRTEMTELQAETEAGRRWIPSTQECFESGKLRAPEEVALATIELLKVAAPHNRGKTYGPDTDFATFAKAE
jgi:3-oxoacyl-[acyl-carrier protein] reductase